MPQAVAPNPYSPWATAAPGLRHIIPVPWILRVAPVPGALATTACGHLAVVPADVIEVQPGNPMPSIACPTCVEAMQTGRPRHLTADLECVNCERPTPHPGLCVLCRQDKHDEWWIEVHESEGA